MLQLLFTVSNYLIVTPISLITITGKEMSELSNAADNNENIDAEANVTLAEAIPQITEAVQSSVNLITGAEGTDEERDRLAADACYEALRTDIGEEITAAILSIGGEDGKVLVLEKPQVVGDSHEGRLYNFGIIGYNTWHSALPLVAQPHYNCNYCSEAWVDLTSMAVMDNKGNIEYPLVNAFIKNSETPIIKAMLDQNPPLQKMIETRASRRPELVPLPQLHQHFIHHTVGGFEHFYGAKKDIVDAYNAQHQTFLDIKYVEVLHAMLTEPDLNIDILTKLLAHIKAQIGERPHTALSRGDALVKLVTTVRDMLKNSRYSFLYLLALLQVKENSWMKHIQSSVLGIVLDGAVKLREDEDMEGVLRAVVHMLDNVTDGVNYKQKTAEASQASVEQAYKFLVENNYANAMRRRLLPLAEAKTVWKKPDAETAAVVEETKVDPLAEAFKQLSDQKNPDVKVNNKLDSILGKVVYDENMSLVNFIKSVADIKVLEVSYLTAIRPVLGFVAAAELPGEYDDFLVFEKSVHDTASVLRTPGGEQFHNCVSLAGVKKEELIDPTYPAMPVTAILRMDRNVPVDGVPNYLLNIPRMGFNFHATTKGQFGTCVLGTTIKTEHFGMSRALVELSSKMTMDVSAGEDAVGGVLLQTGMAFNAVYSDGTRKRILLTSVE